MDSGVLEPKVRFIVGRGLDHFAVRTDPHCHFRIDRKPPIEIVTDQKPILDKAMPPALNGRWSGAEPFHTIVCPADIAIVLDVQADVGQHAAGDVLFGFVIMISDLAKEIDVDAQLAWLKSITLWRAIKKLHVFRIEQVSRVSQNTPVYICIGFSQLPCRASFIITEE